MVKEDKDIQKRPNKYTKRSPISEDSFPENATEDQKKLIRKQQYAQTRKSRASEEWKKNKLKSLTELNKRKKELFKKYGGIDVIE